MARLTSLSLFGLAALGSCRPSPRLDGPIPKLTSSFPILNRENGDGQNDNVTDPIEYCESHKNLATYDDAKQAWDETGAGVQWDIRLAHTNVAADERGWLSTLVGDVFPEKGPSDLDGCLIVGGTCAPESNCTEYVERHYGYMYWVLQSVEGFHGKMSYAREQMQDAAIIGGINIDGINSDFSTELTGDQNTLKWMAAAFTWGAGLASGFVGSPAAGAGIKIASDALTWATDADTFSPDQTKMADWLVEVFKGSTKFIDDSLKIALGGDGDLNELPIRDNFYETRTANYFSDGVWLVNDDNEGFLKAIEIGKENVNKKLVDIALNSVQARLIADSGISDESKCSGPGQLWKPVNDDSYCFYFVTSNHGGDGLSACSGIDPLDCSHTSWEDHVKQDFYDKMIKYGIDLDDYYEALIDCSINGDSFDLDLGSVPLDGSKPRCFFNTPVKKIKWYQAYSGAPKHELTVEDW